MARTPTDPQKHAANATMHLCTYPHTHAHARALTDTTYAMVQMPPNHQRQIPVRIGKKGPQHHSANALEILALGMAWCRWQSAQTAHGWCPRPSAYGHRSSGLAAALAKWMGIIARGLPKCLLSAALPRPIPMHISTVLLWCSLAGALLPWPNPRGRHAHKGRDGGSRGQLCTSVVKPSEDKRKRIEQVVSNPWCPIPTRRSCMPWKVNTQRKHN